MTIITTEHNFDEAYNNVVDCILKDGQEVGNTIELSNVVLVVDNPTLINLVFKRKKVSMKYANAELKWYWSGDNSCHHIGQYAKKWLDITDDGHTNNSAYGFVMFHKYLKNQLEEVIKTLKLDVNSRRAVISLFDPNLDKIRTKDLQCTIALQFLVRNYKLEMTVYMRSNDINYGLPYDYLFFESIHQYIAKRLDITVGRYTHHATSMHCYLQDVEKMENTCNEKAISIDFMNIISQNYFSEKTRF